MCSSDLASFFTNGDAAGAFFPFVVALHFDVFTSAAHNGDDKGLSARLGTVPGSMSFTIASRIVMAMGGSSSEAMPRTTLKKQGWIPQRFARSNCNSLLLMSHAKWQADIQSTPLVNKCMVGVSHM